MTLHSHPQPELPKTTANRRVQRLAIGALIVYALLLLAGSAAGGLWLYDWARERIVLSSALAPGAWTPHASASAAQPATVGVAGQVAVNPNPAEDENQPAAVLQPINVLLIGTDARADEMGPPRTDTIILLTLEQQTQTAGMLSLPRDLWVPIPTYNLTYKLNTVYSMGEERAYSGGGPQLVKDTVSSFIGQPVPYYVRVNFRGFIEIVDLIGGVDINVPKTIEDDHYPTSDYGVEVFHLDAGWQHLDGETALKYARTRNVDDDYGRARRQQDVIKAVFNKVTSADMIPFLLTKLPTLIYTMRSSIDTDIPMATQLELANYMRQASLKEIRQLVLDNRFGEETYSDEGAWILLPDREKVRAAVDEFFTPPSVAVGDGGGATVVADPQNVRIEVLNGTDQPGVAARTRDLLQARGWRVVAIGDADRKDYGHTLVINYGVSAQIMQEVSAALEIQTESPSLAGLTPTTPVDVRIVVGSDFLSHLQP